MACSYWRWRLLAIQNFASALAVVAVHTSCRATMKSAEESGNLAVPHKCSAVEEEPEDIPYRDRASNDELGATYARWANLW